MGSPVWERSRNQQLSYARRRPEETPLYRVIYQYHEELAYVWDDVFRERYGCLRDIVIESFQRYLSCGILRHGCARVACTECSHSELLAFSCKRRGLCPSCDTKRAHLFAENLTQQVLSTHPHRHLVFSLPKRLRVYFRYDRTLTKYLYSAAWSAWRTVTAVDDSPRQTGLVAALHSAGDMLNFHPHIHAIALSGSIDHEDTFYPLERPDQKELEAAFADNVFRTLLREELIDEETVDSMKSWEHSGFGVFIGDASSDSERMLFLARYLKKSTVALERLELTEAESCIRIIKSKDEPWVYRDFTPLDFLAQLSQHIPDVFEQTTRYYGAYSSRTRGATSRKKPNWVTCSSAELEDAPKKASSTWARLIKKVYEVDPLVCPKCGGEMKIVAFIQQQREIKQLCENLGLEDWRAPPPIKSARAEPEIDDFQSLS